MAKREYDIILYGASGYTASYIIKELETSPLKIAVSARNLSRIPETMLPKIECSLDEIEELVPRTELLINCVGPYTLYGDPVIQACIKHSTNYMDICGEPGFLDHVYKMYNKNAKNKNVKIVQSAGFDSLPGDMGVYLLNKNGGNSYIEMVISAKNAAVNRTTWESLILSLQNFYKKNKPNEKIIDNNLKDKKADRKKHNVPEYTYSSNLDSYIVKFRGSDPYVIKRSNKYFKDKKAYESSVSCYMKVGGIFNLLTYYLVVLCIFVLCRFQFTASLLVKYYNIFSLGLVKDRPSPKELSDSSFEIHFTSKNSSNNKVQRLKITGPDPGYTGTAIFITQSAYALIEEGSKVVPGVLTPSIAFHKTKLIERLKSKGIQFKLEFD